MSDIQRLDHAAYRCRDTEETRKFYEDFLELPLMEAFPINTTATGRSANVLHSFFQMADGSCIAFFEAPDQPFEFIEQHDFDLHIALRVDQATQQRMIERANAHGQDMRGPSDHGFIHSIYFRDPNGYVVELAAPVSDAPNGGFDPIKAKARLDEWQAQKLSG